MTKRIITTARIIPDGKPFKLVGRFGWALKNLVDAGKRGCTPIDHPGPRWSAYVHKLRKDYGLVIETVDEKHDGPFPGSHARYVLHTEVEILPADDTAKKQPVSWNAMAADHASISEVTRSFDSFGA